MATSLKLPPQLKSQVEAAAEGASKSPHAFMVEAIEQQVVRAERGQRFVEDALAAEKEALETGEGFGADEVHEAMAARARGGRPRRLKATPWRE